MARDHVVRTSRFLACLALAAFATDACAQTGEPRNMNECMQMTRAPLQQDCATLFAGPDQGESRTACLEQVTTRLRAVCEQLLGVGRDFCATCTSNCTQAFPAGQGKRGECLAMCFRQPGCE